MFSIPTFYARFDFDSPEVNLLRFWRLRSQNFPPQNKISGGYVPPWKRWGDLSERIAFDFDTPRVGGFSAAFLKTTPGLRGGSRGGVLPPKSTREHFSHGV